MRQLLAIPLLLLTLCCCTTERHRTVMRQGLDSLNQRNRTDQPFTVQEADSFVRFFDRHGTANDRLLAHYLLGRAYYEAGEAPMALQCYQDAAERADTTAADCDYKQLSRVYGQMADIFYQQGLYRQELVYDRLAEKYAWQGHDTLAALMNREQSSFAYKRLGLVDSAILILNNTINYYKEYGFDTYAVVALGTIVSDLVEKGERTKAKIYMNQYESKSGFFDEDGNIQEGREIYYNDKGILYLTRSMLDSAEYWFRKELHDGKDFNNQNAGAYGLAMVYEQRHQSDSTAKYYRYAYVMNDSIYAHKTTKTVARMQAIYDYSRHQEEAYRERVKSFQRYIVIWICIGIIIVICLVAFLIFRELSRKRHDTEQKYLQSQTMIEQSRHDIDYLRLREDINKQLISEKEQIIREQETIVKSLLHNDNISQSLADKRLKDAKIYNYFVQLSNKGQQPTHEEWKQIECQIFLCYPGFKEFLSKHKPLVNDKEYKTCLLIRIGLKPTNIGLMLGVTSSYITELRTRMLPKLFGMSGTSKMFDKFIRGIY